MITCLDRLGRSTKDLLNLAFEFQANGVDLEVLEQPITITTPEGRLFFTIIAAFAVFEREIMKARTLDGLASSVQEVAPVAVNRSWTQRQFAIARKLYADKTPVIEIARVLGVSRPTVYRALES